MVWLWRGLLGVVVLGVPAASWAQNYQTLTVAEAAYLHSGLAMQAILRLSSLRQLPQVIMVCCTIWLVYRRVTSPRPQPIAGIVAYLISCGLILVLFWPEAAPRFILATGVRVVRPNGVISYVSHQTGAPIVNAQQSGLVPAALRGDAVVPLALDLILRAVTEMPLLLGNAINPANLDKPFSRVLPMQDFVNQVETAPPSYLTKGMQQFVPLCYEPAIQRVQAANPEITFDDTLPWKSAMDAELAEINLNQGGLRSSTMTCKAFYQDIETKTSEYLRDQTTAGGSSKQAVYRDYLNLRPRQQARIFAQRELQRQVLEVQGPNHVVAAKRLLDAASSAAAVATQFDFTAPFKSAGSQMEKYLDRMARFLGIGSFLVYWGPYLVGIALFVTLSFFPVVLLWSLFPGQHFKPLVNYFLLLIFVCSTPLWWAMVDAAAEVAYAQHPTGGWFTAPVGWGLAYTSYMVVTVLGIIMVPVLQAVLLFGTWRAIGGIWHV